MKAVILAGGFGTRISEESSLVPKPMIKIGDRPILWHILKIYSSYGINDFVICAGYKSQVIKEYFSKYFINNSDVTFDLQSDTIEIHRQVAEPWKVTVVNTGLESMTGGRLLRIKDYVKSSTFCMTYGDGLSDINIAELIQFHKSHGRLATLSAIQPPARFGSLRWDHEQLIGFEEKPSDETNWVNGGFFVLEPGVFDYIENDLTIWEREPLSRLAASENLGAYKHHGFWAPMDTLRDKTYLENIWQSGNVPWKIW